MSDSRSNADSDNEDEKRTRTATTSPFSQRKVEKIRRRDARQLLLHIHEAILSLFFILSIPSAPYFDDDKEKKKTEKEKKGRPM